MCQQQIDGVLTNHLDLTVTLFAFTCSGASAPASLTVTLLPAPPETPQHINVLVNGTTAPLSWAVSDGTDVEYTVVESAKSISTHAVTSTSYSVPCCTKVFTGLSTAYEYVFSVYASNSAGSSRVVSSYPVIPGSSLPPSPADLSAAVSAVAANTVTVTWVVPESTAGVTPAYVYTVYGYYYDAPTTVAFQNLQYGASSTSTTFDRVPLNRNLFFRATATSTAGCLRLMWTARVFVCLQVM